MACMAISTGLIPSGRWGWVLHVGRPTLLETQKYQLWMTGAESPGSLKSNLIVQGSDSCVYRGPSFFPWMVWQRGGYERLILLSPPPFLTGVALHYIVLELSRELWPPN